MKSKSILLSLLVWSYLYGVENSKVLLSDNFQQFPMASNNAIGRDFLIRVFLPPGYFNSDTTNFPVLYLTDGDSFFGAATEIPYFLHFQNPAIIVVGIGYGSWEAAWEKRRDEFRPYSDLSGPIGADKFLTFLQHELIPKIEKEYRTDASHRMLYGWSAGGRFALYTAFKSAGLFRYIMACGAPLYDAGNWAFELEQEYRQNHKELPLELFMGVGEYDSISFPGFHEFINQIQGQQYSGLKFRWKVLPERQHSYISAVAFLHDGLISHFHGTSIFVTMANLFKKQGITQVLLEYEKLKRNESDFYNFAEDELNNLGYFILRQGKIDEAIEIFKLNINEYPDSWNAYDSLTDGYIAIGDKNAAITACQKSLEICPEEERSFLKEKLKSLKE